VSAHGSTMPPPHWEILSLFWKEIIWYTYRLRCWGN